MMNKFSLSNQQLLSVCAFIEEQVASAKAGVVPCSPVFASDSAPETDGTDTDFTVDNKLKLKGRPFSKTGANFTRDMASLRLKGNSVAISMGNPYLQDCELVAISDFFSELTGYGREELVGRNCRILNQGCNVPQDVRHKLRVSVLAGLEVTQVVPNRTKSGRMFANLLTMTSCRVGDRMYILGVQINDETELGTNISSHSGYWIELQAVIDRVFEFGVEQWAERQLENFCVNLPISFSVQLSKLNLCQGSAVDNTFLDTTGWAVSCKNSFLHVEDSPEDSEPQENRFMRSSSIPKLTSLYACIPQATKDFEDDVTNSRDHAIQTPDSWSDDEALGG